MKKQFIKSIGTLLNTGAYLAPKYTARKGFELFCTPPVKVKLNSRQKEFMKTSERFRMSADGIPEIQIYKWGNGPKKILFVHGWISHSFRWIKYILGLQSEEFTIYALDGPAHGYSEGKIMNIPLYQRVLSAFTKQYGDMNYYVGHSLGSFALLFHFYKNPNLNTDKLIILSTPGEATDFVDLYSTTLGLTQKTMKLILDYFTEKYNHPTYYSLERFATSIHVPGLIIHDIEDRETPIKYGRRLHELWPQSTIIETQGLGHKLRDEHVIQQVLDYIKK